jgi:hypothetical protein
VLAEALGEDGVIDMIKEEPDPRTVVSASLGRPRGFS